MTLVEFLAPLKGGKRRDIVLATMFYVKRQDGEARLTVEKIRSQLVQARVPKAKTMNIAAILAGSGELVDTAGSDGSRLLWALTDTGEKHVRALLELPKIDLDVQHDVASLNALVAKVADPVIRDYIEEAITCLSVNALRAAIVFLWAAAIRTLQEKAMALGDTVVNAAIQRQDPKARQIKKVDDFAYVKERTFIDAIPDMGLVDKGEKDTLVDALNLRNRCGHPTKVKPGINKTRSFIEDVVGIVFV